MEQNICVLPAGHAPAVGSQHARSGAWRPRGSEAPGPRGGGGSGSHWASSPGHDAVLFASLKKITTNRIVHEGSGEMTNKRAMAKEISRPRSLYSPATSPPSPGGLPRQTLCLVTQRHETCRIWKRLATPPPPLPWPAPGAAVGSLESSRLRSPASRGGSMSWPGSQCPVVPPSQPLHPEAAARALRVPCGAGSPPLPLQWSSPAPPPVAMPLTYPGPWPALRSWPPTTHSQPPTLV